jgi:hypothetical protein
VSVVDSTLHRRPVYTHPLSLAGADRGIIDLLACDDIGRLVVLELKATEDLHLPLQGLDYWMRVKWHLDRGEFVRKGYFPGIELSPLPPRLVLVSPAVEFHPTTETVLRHFPPEVVVERVGVSEDWRRELSVVFRKMGGQVGLSSKERLSYRPAFRRCLAVSSSWRRRKSRTVFM